MKIDFSSKDLPSLEIIGKEWNFDVSTQDKVDQLKELSNFNFSDNNINQVIDSIKKIVRLVFIKPEELILELEEKFEQISSKKSGLLWKSFLMKLLPEITRIHNKDLDDQLKELNESTKTIEDN